MTGTWLGSVDEVSPSSPAPVVPLAALPRLRPLDLAWRYLLALGNVVLAVGGALYFVLHPARWTEARGHSLGPGVVLALELLLGVAGLVLIRFRRQRPLVVSLVLSGFSAVAGGCWVLAGWALGSLAARRRWRPIALAVAAFVLAALAQTQVMEPGRASWLELGQVTLFYGLGAVALVAVGLFTGARRALLAEALERVEAAEREQELRVLQGQAAERNRIAREMHDVLAHRLSLVSMHAGALAYRQDLSPEQARETARVIQENAHASLGELRAVLGSLRDEAMDATPVAKPQPGRLDVADLVAAARAAGMRLTYEDEVEHVELLPTLTARHAHRIVQEALTNARKHAPGCRVWLRLAGAPGGQLAISCRNSLPVSAPSPVPGSQVGLVGVRERVDVSGGTMAVRRDDDEFTLEVALPW